METVLTGLGDAWTLTNAMWVLAGIVLGQFVGAVPGLNAPMAIAIAVPFTFSMSPLAAIAFLIGINKGSTVGGAIPAVLINTPGTPDAAATALDGYPLAKQGKGLKAMKMALFSSVTGDTASDLVLFTVAAPLSIVALMMGPAEIAALMIFALTLITGLLGTSMARGLTAAFLGLLCGTVGLDPGSATPRLAFGVVEVYDGLPLPAVALGLLAVGEILRQLVSGNRGQTAALPMDTTNPANYRLSLSEYASAKGALWRGAAMGTLVGALPGIGSTAAAFVTYDWARRSSKHPELFGKGSLEGIAAAEAANSAVVGANLIPLLTLGIPGNVTAALIVGALIIQGIQPGPLLFQEQGRLIYGLFGAMMMANVTNLFIGYFGLRFWAKVVQAPASVIFPISLVLCVVGTYVTTGNMLGVGLMLAFGVLGLLMRAFDFSVVAFIIAFVIGDQFELALAQTMTLADGNPAFILRHPIALLFLALSAWLVWRIGILGRRGRMGE